MDPVYLYQNCFKISNKKRCFHSLNPYPVRVCFAMFQILNHYNYTFCKKLFFSDRLFCLQIIKMNHSLHLLFPFFAGYG